MVKNYYILRTADICHLVTVLCELLRSGTFGACIDSQAKDQYVRGRLLEIGSEFLMVLVGYQAQLKRKPASSMRKLPSFASFKSFPSAKNRESVISCLAEGLTSPLSGIPQSSALPVKVCVADHVTSFLIPYFYTTEKLY